MAKANLDGVPEIGSKWDLDGLPVTVDRFKAKGRGGWVIYSSGSDTGNMITLSQFRERAKAA